MNANHYLKLENFNDKVLSFPPERRKVKMCLAAFSMIFVLASSEAMAEGRLLWNPTADFSTIKGNPNGVWSYGLMKEGFTEFTLYNINTANGWSTLSGNPSIWKNTANTTIAGVPPSHISFHPGPKAEPSVLRWTTPKAVAGTVTIKGKFLPGDKGSMRVGVRKDGVELWNAVDHGEFDLQESVKPGTTIDFCVYGGYGWGNTPLEAQITKISR